MNDNLTIPGLDKRTTLVILTSTAILMAWSIASSLIEGGPISATIITFILYSFYWFYALYYKNPLIHRLVVFGTIAGILELVADHYLVETANSLVYPQEDIMIWSSPVYMPFAWSNVLLQLGFIGILLTQKYDLLKASIMLSIAGGMYIPLYEYLAKNANWWVYNANSIMLFDAPVYVIVCEALISLSLPILITYSINHKLQTTFLLGIAEGIWIILGAMATFVMFS